MTDPTTRTASGGEKEREAAFEPFCFVVRDRNGNLCTLGVRPALQFANVDPAIAELLSPASKGDAA